MSVKRRTSKRGAERSESLLRSCPRLLLRIKTNAADLRGKTVRFGNIKLVTHVLKPRRSLGADKLSTDIIQDDTVWALEKCELNRDGTESCFVIANVEFKNPITQEEYDLRSIGSRLVDSITPEDLAPLKRIVELIDQHCYFRHELRYYGDEKALAEALKLEEEEKSLEDKMWKRLEDEL